MAFRKFVKERAKDIYEQRKLSKFLEEYCSKDDLQRLAKKSKLKTSGNKGQLSKRIISIPEFDLDVIKQAFNKSNLQKISRDLGIPATGDKDELWTRIILKKGFISEDSISVQTDYQLSNKISDKPKIQSNDVEKAIIIEKSSAVEPEPLTIKSLSNMIGDWVPSRRFKTEETYQNDLRTYLEYKKNLEVQVEAGITQVDILVEKAIPIELKKNPKRTDFDRLFGQIERNIEVYGKLIVVICQLQSRDLFNEYKNRCQYSTEQLEWIIK
ncbi:MAG: hypothetical protein ACXADY_16780 [Candidatus Hodarchaeales archaeon]|jgi:hypothetical protein